MNEIDQKRRVKVSVGMPVFNGEAYLEQAIESLLAQDFEDFELVISDNASTDRTEAICRDYASQDKRVRIHRNEHNIGAIPNHNLVFQLSESKFFKWAAHDDECDGRFLSGCVGALENAGESAVLAYPRALLIDETGHVIQEYTRSIESRSSSPPERVGKLVGSIRLGTPIYGVVRSSALRRTRLLGSYLGSDQVLLAELALLGEIVEHPAALLRKRIHPGRATQANVGYRDWQNWADTSRNPRRQWVNSGDRIDLEYAIAVCRADMRVRDKARSLYSVIKNSQTQRARLDRWKKRVGLSSGARVDRAP